MKENGAKIIRWALAIVGIAAVLAFIRFATLAWPRAGAQEDGTQRLEERLEQLGVPVKRFTVTSRSPVKIEVVLRGTGGQEDFRNRVLAKREIELDYRYSGIRISSYRLVVETDLGTTISDNTLYLGPDFSSQRMSPATPSSVGPADTREILAKNFDLHGFELVKLEVPSSYSASDNSKLAALVLSTGTTIEQTDASQIDKLMVSVHPQIEAINDRYGTRIVLVHIRILDSNGELLVDFLKDMETWSESSWVDEHIKVGWYPQPAATEGSEPTDAPVVPMATIPPSTPAVVTPVTYPPPAWSATDTPVFYPEP
jgi:hypothetical protein